MHQNDYNYNYIFKYIIVKGNRFFIDICEHGCGSGCKYCYASDHDKPQMLIEKEKIEYICKYIKDNYNCNNSIISLCPNTEPLKSKESMELIIYIISCFTDTRSYIQISTKEIIPKWFLEKINQLSNSNIYINISVPIIRNAHKLEPNAAPITKRFDNFNKINLFDKIKSCLYIKPFITQDEDFKEYITFINHHNIKAVCVGPYFDVNSQLPCVSLYDKEKARNIYNNQADDINRFIQLLRANTQAKVFSSSVCCIYSDQKEECTLKLFNYSNELCKDCLVK